MESYEVLRQAFKKVGCKTVAAELKLSPSLVHQWSRGQKGTSAAVNPVDRVKQLVELTDGDEILEWLCAQRGGLFVRRSQLPAQLREYKNLLLGEFQKIFQSVRAAWSSPATRPGGPQCRFRRSGQRCSFPHAAQN
jgi:hypothetical protein